MNNLYYNGLWDAQLTVDANLATSDKKNNQYNYDNNRNITINQCVQCKPLTDLFNNNKESNQKLALASCVRSIRFGNLYHPFW